MVTAPAKACAPDPTIVNPRVRGVTTGVGVQSSKGCRAVAAPLLDWGGRPVSPRVQPTRHDATAHAFLAAAAQLIDASLAPTTQARPARLRSLDFPAALHWVRVDDVLHIAQAQQGSGVSRKAFHNRWATKDEFVRDAVIYTLNYADSKDTDPDAFVQFLPQLTVGSFASGLSHIADSLLHHLEAHPRSYLLLHLGPVIGQYPELNEAIQQTITKTRQAWHAGYLEVLAGLGARPRPGWTVERLELALQAMLDGFLIRGRLQNERMQMFGWAGASLFADTVIAFTAGAIETAGPTSRSSRDELDRIVGRLAEQTPAQD
jgi:AcrR family transcriptional regulator